MLPLTKLEITGISGRLVISDLSAMKILPWIALPMLYIGIVANHSLFYATYWH